MRIRKFVVVSLSVAVFFVSYIVILSVLAAITAFIASRALILENIMVSLIHVSSFIFGIVASVAAHTASGAVIGRLAVSDTGALSITRTHTNIILAASVLLAVLSLASGDTIIPPLAMLIVTLYLRAKLMQGGLY